MSKPFVVAIDFDGTIVDHRFPDIGDPAPGAFRWMKEWQAAGARLILWTMRSDSDREGPVLLQAVQSCKDNGVEFWSVNGNPSQSSWTSSPKCYAHAYVDDAALGCPLRESPRSGGRPMADWEKIGPAVLALIAAHKAKEEA